MGKEGRKEASKEILGDFSSTPRWFLIPFLFDYHPCCFEGARTCWTPYSEWCITLLHFIHSWWWWWWLDAGASNNKPTTSANPFIHLYLNSLCTGMIWGQPSKCWQGTWLHSPGQLGLLN
jgi:hypothetical protein